MSRRIRRLLAVVATTVVLVLAAAGVWQATRPTGPVTAEDRAVAVEQTLRCPTCQGLSIADSPSPIAAGMRHQVQRQLAAGATVDQVRSFFTARYGDWILLDPPRRGIGWLVWLLPAAGLVAGAWLVRRTLRRRTAATPNRDELSAEELDAADVLAERAATGLLSGPLPEQVTAALADLHAARLDADIDPAAAVSVEDARRRLGTVLRERSSATSGQTPSALPAATASTIPASTATPSQAAVSDRNPGDDAAPVPVFVTGSGSGQTVEGEPIPIDRGILRRRRAIRYALPAAALLFAGLLALTLSGTLGDRPAGAVVTGNFASSSTGPKAAGGASSELAALQQATRQQPTDPAAWLAYATALDKAGDLAGAEPAYRKTLALDPGNLAATEQYAWLLTRGGSPQDALTLLTPLAAQRPDDPQVVLLLGLAQRGADDPAASSTLRRYLTLAPSSPQAAVIRGLLGSTP